jgi:hypothetical protein
MQTLLLFLLVINVCILAVWATVWAHEMMQTGARPLPPDLSERSRNPNRLVSRRCEICAAAMYQVRSLTKFGPHPELATYRCDECGNVITLVAENEHGQSADV